jgi:hypothetical protein
LDTAVPIPLLGPNPLELTDTKADVDSVQCTDGGRDYLVGPVGTNWTVDEHKDKFVELMETDEGPVKQRSRIFGNTTDTLQVRLRRLAPDKSVDFFDPLNLPYFRIVDDSKHRSASEAKTKLYEFNTFICNCGTRYEIP